MSQHSRLALESFKKKFTGSKNRLANIKVAANPYAAQHRCGVSTCAPRNTWPKTHVFFEKPLSQALSTDTWFRATFDKKKTFLKKK
jgi:hypothetical protein